MRTCQPGCRRNKSRPARETLRRWFRNSPRLWTDDGRLKTILRSSSISMNSFGDFEKQRPEVHLGNTGNRCRPIGSKIIRPLSTTGFRGESCWRRQRRDALLLSLLLADDDDPLFLQIKEARRSVLESPRGKSRYAHQGFVVVRPASDASCKRHLSGMVSLSARARLLRSPVPRHEGLRRG